MATGTMAFSSGVSFGNSSMDGHFRRGAFSGETMAWSDIYSTNTASGDPVGTYYHQFRPDNGTLDPLYAYISVSTLSTRWYEDFYRTVLTFDTSALPAGAVPSSATLGLWIDSTFGMAYLQGKTTLALCETTLPSADTAQTWRYTEFTTKELAENRIAGVATSSTRTYFTLNREGLNKISTSTFCQFGLVLNWDIDRLEPIGLSAGSYIAIYPTAVEAANELRRPLLSVLYEISSRTFGDNTRRFELPQDTPRFSPTRTSTRFGAPLTLQDVRAERIELQTQVQDFANEAPPFIMRSLQGDPDSRLSARAGTLLVDPNNSRHNLWYKRVGSGNTGWVPLGLAYDTTGIGSEFSTVEVTSAEVS